MSQSAVGIRHIGQVAQRARDLDQAIEFYGQTLGAQFLARFDPPGLAFFRFGQVRLLLEASAPSATLYFAVDDIDASYAGLTSRGVQFEQEPLLVHRDDTGLFGDAGEEEWMAFFRDPDGNLLAISSALRARPVPTLQKRSGCPSGDDARVRRPPGGHGGR
ncbi:MAG: VOC family protein [Actinomycetota bacterium]|nr:VOC family protein [Actinomycetota bacterium]